MARKYPEVKGYWVYSIYVPSVNKYYIGVSRRKECNQRWKKGLYVGMSLESYLDEWDSMIKTVLIDGLTKEESYQYEGKIIDALQMNDLCINKQRSGLIEVSNPNAYHKELLKNNPEYCNHKKQYTKQYQKQRYDNDVEYREREKQRSKQWRLNNKEKVNQQARQRYQKKKLQKQQNQTSLPL